MKNSITFLAILTLSINFLAVSAAGDHGHGHGDDKSHIWESKFLTGTWLIASRKIVKQSDHDHGDGNQHDEGDDDGDNTNALVDSSPTNTDDAKFHAGHKHAPSAKTAPMRINLCTDASGELFGKIRNRRLLRKTPKNFEVTDLSIDHDDMSFNISAVTTNPNIQDAPLTLKIELEDHDNPDLILVSFDGGDHYFRANRKNDKTTRACQKLIESSNN